MAKRKNVYLSKIDTAYVMGISVQAFDKWDIVPETKKGVEVYYDLKQVIAYRFDREPRKGYGELTKNKTKIAEVQAEKAELELAAMKGEYILSEVVKEVWSDLVSTTRAKLLSIPTKLAQSLTVAKTSQKIESILREAIKEALYELKDYSPDEYSISKRILKENN